MDNYQIKNTKPAVMKDRGPYDTDRSKSADGRYTAGKKGYNLELQPDDAPGTDQIWMKKRKEKGLSEGDKIEAALDEKIYTPLFEYITTRHFLTIHMYKNNPEIVPFIMRTNKYYDEILGVDYAFGSKNSRGKVNQPVITTDLKVVDTFGHNERYNNPMVPLNLRKTVKGVWQNSSFLNENHENDFFTYFWPKSRRTKFELKRNPDIDPQISEIKIFHVPSENLQNYINETIMQNDIYINAMKNFEDGTSTEPVRIPIAGTSAYAELFMQVSPKTGAKSIRMSVPLSVFEDRRTRSKLSANIKPVEVVNLFNNLQKNT